MNKADQDYRRCKALVMELTKRLRLLDCDVWNPNTECNESGVDAGITLQDGSRIGVQVTEIDPYPEPGTRGRERSRSKGSESGVVGNFAQNDPAVILDAIRRAIEKKSLIRPASSEFDKAWLLLCAGLPDAPTSTFILTAPLAASDLDAQTRNLLFKSCYYECFILPFFNTVQIIYRWSRNETARWKKSVRLEEIAQGTAGDAEYFSELLRTRGNDESLVDAQVARVLAEIRETPQSDELANGSRS